MRILHTPVHLLLMVYFHYTGPSGHEPAVDFLQKTGQAHTVESVCLNITIDYDRVLNLAIFSLITVPAFNRFMHGFVL